MRNQNCIIVAGLTALGLAVPAFANYTFTTLASFNSTNGALPVAGLTLYGGNLYGTTSAGGIGGTIFSVPAAGGPLSPLASFNFTSPSGESPKCVLVVDPSGTTLYGTTSSGGPGMLGSVFSVPIAGGTPTALATFGGGTGPNPDLVLSGNTLYGTARSGGASLQGTVFSVPASGGTPVTLATFSGGNGSDPWGGLVVSGGKLYGTTSEGPSGQAGSVFSLPIAGGSPTTLCIFNNSTGGIFPLSDLIVSGGTLYGTTSSGPGADSGTVFSLPITGGTPTTLATFNGATPVGALALVGTSLYGITQDGGSDNDGIVFSVPTTGGVPTTIYSFTSPNNDGSDADNLIADSAGDLFGTTNLGGSGSEGTVFELSQTVPEPTSVALLGMSAVGLLGRRRKTLGTILSNS